MNRLLSLATWLLLLSLAAPSPARAASDVPALASFVDAVRGYDVSMIRRSFPAYSEGLFALVYGAGPGIDAADPAIAALFAGQLVITPAGQVLDIGHVITALEAAAAPTAAAQLVARQTGCDMRAAVSWSGDAGKALHDYVAAGAAGSVEDAFDRDAPAADLLGDIDGWVLALSVQPGALDVAALLEHTYLADGSFERTRYQRFVQATGGGDSLDSDARAFIGQEIRCFAAATAALGRSEVTDVAIAAAAPPFVERFLRFIEEGLAAERLATPSQ